MIAYPIRFRVQKLTENGAPDGAARTLLCEDPGTFSVGKADDCDVQLEGNAVSRRHFSLILDASTVSVRDDDSTNGVFVNGTRVAEIALGPGDIVTIPGWQLALVADAAPAADPGALVLSRIVQEDTPPRASGASGMFDQIFGGDRVVSRDRLMASGLPMEEARFCAIGGGLGSFVFVDHLRCYGVPATQIRSVGTERVCYTTYKRYCRNSQIPDHERLRSNSLSRPDNIWGFPGYAMREAGKRGYVKGIFQVFGEPALSESYTPRAGDVYDSLDIEARRIGWDAMFRQGQVRGLRMTDDARYVVAYQPRGDGAADGPKLRLILADVVHLSTGYPATRFVDDFQEFIAAHPEKRGCLANAYEFHDGIYQSAETAGGPVDVVVRGRGIVASRIIQRLSEARARNPQITILHSVRSQLGSRDGATYGRARRAVINNVEVQPFNWPKSCWGGELRVEYEDADEIRRGEILTGLGGTSTADRTDWVRIAERGTREGWYRPVYGSITEMSVPDGVEDRVRIVIGTPEGRRQEILANYLIDCTGLIADLARSPFLADLLDLYGLERNHGYAVKDGRTQKGGPTGLRVSDDFEVEGLRNGRGRVYAAGTITTGGPYLAVDSFLGLQYAALRAVDHMVVEAIHGVPDLTPLRSASGWLKWMGGVAP